jgi:hypothetical protein
MGWVGGLAGTSDDDVIPLTRTLISQHGRIVMVDGVLQQCFRGVSSAYKCFRQKGIRQTGEGVKGCRGVYAGAAG